MKICVQAVTDKMRGHKAIKWGDYWFKRQVCNTFEYLGQECVLRSHKAEVSLLLHGNFNPSSSFVKSVWVYGNLSTINADVFQKYFQLIYTLSDKSSQHLQAQGIQCSTLLPATSTIYSVSIENISKEVVFMGSVKDYDISCPRLSYLRQLGNAKICPIDVIGEGWNKYTYPNSGMNFVSRYWNYENYHDLFSKYKLAIYIHASNMLPWNLVALRILDMIATGNCLVISDYNDGLIKMFGDVIPTFKTGDELISWTDYFLSHETERKERWHAAREIINKQHLLKHRVEKMLADYENLLR